MTTTEIKPGKFYRMTDGVTKFWCYSTEGASPDHPIHGGIPSGTGKWLMECVNPNQLISEWHETPEVDWSAMPKWAQWVARDESGQWWWYEFEPHKGDSMWVIRTVDISDRGVINKSFHPKNYTGPWQDSNVKRPEGV